MRRYETVFILRPSLAEEQINSLIENTSNIIKSGNGRIIELDKWGLKKLSYPIKKESLGYYVYCDFVGSPDAVTEMERKFKIDDSYLRFLTLKTANAISTEEAEAIIADVANRKAAEALAAEQEDTVPSSEESDDSAEANEE